MKQTQSNQPAGKSTALIAVAPARESARNQIHIFAGLGKISRNAALTLAALLLLALPVGVALNNRQDLATTWRPLDRFFHRPSANSSPVLAVDARGMTIHGKNLTLTGRKRVEQATIEQLAQLHHIYAGWVPTDEDAVGSLVLKLQVDRVGNVKKIEAVQSRLSSSDFTKVVFTEMRQWNFPADVAESLEISLPLLFVPKGLDANTVVQWERRVGNRAAAPKIASQPANVTPPPGPALNHEARVQKNADATQVNGKKPAVPKAVLPIVKTTRAVALRQSPRFAAETVHEVDADTELNLLERKGSWLKVRMADASTIGFVRKEYLAPLH